jgi:hypothetical protein
MVSKGLVINKASGKADLKGGLAKTTIYSPFPNVLKFNRFSQEEKRETQQTIYFAFARCHSEHDVGSLRWSASNRSACSD